MFPNSKVKAGLVGIAENVGDASTFWILTEDREQLFLNTKVKACFVGIAENVGNASTFWILTEDREQLISKTFFYQDCRRSKDNKHATRSDLTNTKKSYKDSCWNERLNPKCNFTFN